MYKILLYVQGESYQVFKIPSSSYRPGIKFSIIYCPINLPTVPLAVKSSGSRFQPSALPKTDYDLMGMSSAETNTKSSFGSAYDANTTTITFKSY